MLSIRVLRSAHLCHHSPLSPILTLHPVERSNLSQSLRCVTSHAFPNKHLVFNHTAKKTNVKRITEKINVETAETVILDQKPIGPVLTNFPITPHALRPYQQECIDECLKLYHDGIRRQVVSLPVGSGKTVIFANLISSLPCPTERSTKSLVLAHREELLEQARKQILRVNPRLVVELDQGNTQATLHPNVDVVVASVSSLGRKSSNRLEKYDPAEFKAIIIDEAHHASAEIYLRILKHFGVCKPAETEANSINEMEAKEHEEKEESKILVWGCSATVRRHDGIGLAAVFDHIAYTKSFLGMIDDGWLCDMRVSTVETAVDLSNVKISKARGDFHEAELSQAVNIAARNEAVVKAWLNLAWSQAPSESMSTPSSPPPLLTTKPKQRRSTLAFAVDIKHVYDLTDAFRRLGIDARSLTSLMSSADRHELLNEFRAGTFPVLVNCGILTEGTDIPQIDCVILARPTQSATLFQQMIGRGMRLSQETGKVDCLMLDYVDNFKRTGKDGLITIPTLLGLNPDTILKDYVPRSADRAIVSDNDLEDLTRGTAEIDVTTYMSPNDFLGYNSDSKEIRNFSTLSWVGIRKAEDKKDYVLSLFNGMTICLSVDKTGIWGAQVRPKKNTVDGETIYIRPYALLIADTLQMAVKGTETWLQSQPQGHIAMKIANKWANWRKAPATDAQRNFLSKVFKLEDMKTLKKGEAMDLITQWREGKIKFLKESIKRDNKVKAEEQKRKKRLQNIRGLVAVGPLNTEKKIKAEKKK